MNDLEFSSRLNAPTQPCTGSDILRHIKATGSWRVERVLGSAGEFVIDVTYIPLDWHGCVVCCRAGDDTYTVQAVRSSASPTLALAGTA